MFLVSLPVRECGLKLKLIFKNFNLFLSLPVRECGLKSDFPAHDIINAMSLPVRECGLKFHGGCAGRSKCRVTPRAGVWIEMVVKKSYAPGMHCHSPCGSVD